jgi:hypothetical protein
MTEVIIGYLYKTSGKIQFYPCLHNHPVSCVMVPGFSVFLKLLKCCLYGIGTFDSAFKVTFFLIIIEV